MKRFLHFLIPLVMGLSLLTACNPDFHLNGKAEITLEINTTFSDPLTNLPQAEVSGSVDTSQIGRYTLTYTVTLEGKVKTLQRIINVVDTTKPRLTLNGELRHASCALDFYTEEGYTALDNGDGDIASWVTITQDKNKLLYKVSDRAGNTSQAVRTFDLNDTTAPQLILKGPELIQMPKGGTYYEYGVDVSDDCGNASTLSVKTVGQVDQNTLGEYTVRYSVTDPSGNTTERTRTIRVVDQPPTIVYLTFDDGPHTNTQLVLDILKQYNALATFFVVRRDPKYNDLVTRAYQEGHTVALHSNTHNYLDIYASEANYFADLYLVQDYVYELTGHRSWIVRFPGGSSNTVSRFNPGIMTTLTKAVQREGFHYFDWSVSTGDGNSANPPQIIIDRALKYIRIGKSNVVLMHDGAGHDETVAALPTILDYLMSINAVLLPITMETPEYHHHIQN